MSEGRKSDLPMKPCAVCDRPFIWRRKWARVWDEVRYCSNRCRRAVRFARYRCQPSGHFLNRGAGLPFLQMSETAILLSVVRANKRFLPGLVMFPNQFCENLVASQASEL